MTIQTLETSRLVLRLHTLADFAAFAAQRADPVVMKYMGSGPIGEEEAWGKFQSLIGHWQLLGWGTWAVEEKASGRYLGALGYAEKKRPKEHPASGAPEMGWSFVSAAHGKGFASEALVAALVWGRDYFGPARVVCVIDDNNAASIRLADKHGFQQFAHAERTGKPRLVFKRIL
jgi:RimJ/RimL family protein N-acetyltransferase